MPLLLHMPRPVGVRAFWAITIGVSVLALWLALMYAPVDGRMGLAQKLVYLHIPSAAGAMLAAAAVFGASAASIWSRWHVWERTSLAAARVVVVCAGVVLVTGMVWGKSEWGVWWTWSPRLTFTLVLCVLYAVLLVLHHTLSPARRAMVCAVYGVVAFLDVPLVYLSARLLPEVHPTSLPLTSEMRITLVAWFALTLLVCVGVIAAPLVRWMKRVETAHRCGCGQ